jgi:hypothetical protein
LLSFPPVIASQQLDAPAVHWPINLFVIILVGESQSSAMKKARNDDAQQF